MTLDSSSIPFTDKLYIGGAWVDPIEGGFFTLISPETEREVWRVARASNADVDRAVQAAREAFDTGPWGKTTPSDRIALLEQFKSRLQARSADLSAAVQLQIGAPGGMAPVITAFGLQSMEDVLQIGRTFQFEQRRRSSAAGSAFIVREPAGVVAAIAPWNAPFMTMVAKVTPALLAGCTIVMKPAPETPLEAYIMANCAAEVGFPPGVLNLVTADRDASDHLVSNTLVDKVSFTGSTLAGRRIASVCAERIARCTLELGGKSAAIVAEDMSIEEAARILASTISMHSGQICQMLSRAIVPRRRHDELAQAIAHEMKLIKLGYSNDPTAQMGPLAMKRQLERVEMYVEAGLNEGATLVSGGRRPPNLAPGYFYEPTLFSNVTNDMRISREEIFGPVLSLLPCDDIDDGIRIANESIFGLNGSVLTHDPKEAYRISRAMRTGNIGQNGLHVDFALPFGGFKQSGIGREGDVEGLMSYLETKTILIHTEGFEPAAAV